MRFLALALALRTGAPRYSGVWAMSCALPVVEGVELDLQAGAGTPALVQVGDRDPIIPPERGREAAAAEIERLEALVATGRKRRLHRAGLR